MFFRRLLVSLFVVVLSLIGSIAGAETLDRCTTLLEDAAQASSTTGSIIMLPVQDPKSISAVSTASNTSGTTPTFDIEIQSCRTKTGPCAVRASFDQCTTGSCYTTGFQTYDVPDGGNWYRYFRAKTTLGGTSPVYNVKAEVCY